jgi:hypothetical protein
MVKARGKMSKFISPDRLGAVIPAGARAIPLSQGKYALVDEADYPDLIRHSWCATREGATKPGHHQTFYATRSIKKSRTSKVNRGIRMHRQIMDAKARELFGEFAYLNDV